jgi:hypothetical protein
MSNFKNYILKAKGKKTNINISGFINENFSKYIAKFAGYVFNEDINYRIGDSGNINIEYDTGDNKKTIEPISGINGDSSIKDLYEHILKFYSVGTEGFILNSKTITSVEEFENKIKEIKGEEIKSVRELDISPTPFFHITAIGIDDETKKRFNDFFIKTTRLHEYIFSKDNVNKMNEIITTTFNKEKKNGNKFFFHRVGLDGPVIFDKELKKSADNACANLATSIFFDESDNNKNKTVNILNLIIEEMGKKIKVIENKKDKAQNDKQKIRDLNTEIEIITEFKKDLSKEIKKGILEIKLTKNILTL